MIHNAVFRRTRPYNEEEIYLAIMAYLENNFIFRRLEIDKWLDDDRIIYIRKGTYSASLLEPGKTAEELWNDGAFEDWTNYSEKTVESLCEDFSWFNMLSVAIKRKRLVKEIIKAEIEKGVLTQTVKFRPVLKKMIDQGRQKVLGVKPLPFGSHKRMKIDLNEGDLCYFCWYVKPPYMANPAIVFEKFQNAYSLIFFTNFKNGTETSQPSINMGRFLTVQADELGRTPAEAVLQRYC